MSEKADRVPLRKKIFVEKGAMVDQDVEVNAEAERIIANSPTGELAEKVRMNIWISPENLAFLRQKAEHSGTNVTVLCSLAVSDYCDEQRRRYQGVNMMTEMPYQTNAQRRAMEAYYKEHPEG